MNHLLFKNISSVFNFSNILIFRFSQELSLKSAIMINLRYSIWSKFFFDRLRGIEIYFLKTDFVKVPNHLPENPAYPYHIMWSTYLIQIAFSSSWDCKGSKLRICDDHLDLIHLIESNRQKYKLFFPRIFSRIILFPVNRTLFLSALFLWLLDSYIFLPNLSL